MDTHSIRTTSERAACSLTAYRHCRLCPNTPAPCQHLKRAACAPTANHHYLSCPNTPRRIPTPCDAVTCATPNCQFRARASTWHSLAPPALSSRTPAIIKLGTVISPTAALAPTLTRAHALTHSLVPSYAATVSRTLLPSVPAIATTLMQTHGLSAMGTGTVTGCTGSVALYILIIHGLTYVQALSC